MFFRNRKLQYEAKPERPDPVYARKLQEILGGQWGEMSVMMSYLFQGWNCRAPDKYRDMLSFLIARDTMHQNQWLAAIEELREDGLESTPAPQSFPQEREKSEVAYQFWNCSEGTESQQGRWAKGRSVDGKGEIEYLADPQPMGPEPRLGAIDPRAHGTPKEPKAPVASE